MSCFDTVVFKCTRCNVPMEVQSKSGKCELRKYSPNGVPLEVVSGLGRGVVCKNCGENHRVVVSPHMPRRISMMVKSIPREKLGNPNPE